MVVHMIRNYLRMSDADAIFELTDLQSIQLRGDNLEKFKVSGLARTRPPSSSVKTTGGTRLLYNGCEVRGKPEVMTSASEMSISTLLHCCISSFCFRVGLPARS